MLLCHHVRIHGRIFAVIIKNNYWIFLCSWLSITYLIYEQDWLSLILFKKREGGRWRFTIRISIGTTGTRASLFGLNGTKPWVLSIGNYYKYLIFINRDPISVTNLNFKILAESHFTFPNPSHREIQGSGTRKGNHCFVLFFLSVADGNAKKKNPYKELWTHGL